MREAQARMLWFGGFGLTLTVALGTIVAMIWVVAVAMETHWWPVGLPPATWGRRAMLILSVALFAAVSAAIFATAYLLVKTRIFFEFGVPLPQPQSWREWLTFDDSLQSYVFGSNKTDPAILGTLFRGGVTLLTRLEVIVLFAGIAIAGAVTATLYQHPEQVQSRRQAKKTAGVMPRQPPDAYDQFLARCFQRLSVAIYFGAVLLVVSVACISAQYSWPAALLDPDAADEPIKSHLTTALKALADQYAFEYGMIFTSLLFGLFLPAWVVLRRRAWEVARVRAESGTTQDTQQKWLEFARPRLHRRAACFTVPGPAGAGRRGDLYCHPQIARRRVIRRRPGRHVD